MTILASVLDGISLGDAGTVGILGYALVFLGLVLLMVVVILLGKVLGKKPAPAPVAQVVEAPAPVAPPAPPVAPGSAGQLKLYNTPPKTAAMLMAIVADKMGKPLNELRFLSIKEVQ